MEFDNLLPKLGGFGRYQKFVFALLCIPAALPCSFTYFSNLFMVAAPNHWCRVPELLNLSLEERLNLSVPWEEREGLQQRSRCQMYDVNYTELLSIGISMANSSWPLTTCKNGWEFDRSLYKKTLVTEMEIVCDKFWQVGLAETLLFSGGLFGNIFFGWWSDRYGRRNAFFIVVIANVLLGVVTSFSPNFTFYLVTRLLIGATFIPLYQIPFVLALELMSPEKRVTVATIMAAVFSIGMMILSLMAWAVKDWFILSLISSVPFSLLMLYWWVLPESPRWLLSMNRVKEAEAIVQKIAKVNDKKIPPDFLTQEVARSRQAAALKLKESPESVEEEIVPSCMDLVKYPNIRKNAIIVNYAWICNAVVYIGLSYAATNLGVNDYLAFLISGIVEIPGLLIACVLMDYVGRRPTLFGSMLLAGLTCLGTTLVDPANQTVLMILTNAGKLGISGSFSVVYMYAGELFPTSLRSMAISTGSITSTATIIASRPLLSMLSYYNRLLPVIILGCMSLSGAIVGAFLPETLGTHLPQTIAEGEALGIDSNFWTCFPTFGKKKKKCEDQSEMKKNTNNAIYTIKLN